jgi:hypothetical protein
VAYEATAQKGCFQRDLNRIRKTLGSLVSSVLLSGVLIPPLLKSPIKNNHLNDRQPKLVFRLLDRAVGY